MKLEKQKNTKSGFKIPENYFEDFRSNISDLIIENKSERKTNHRTLIYAIAASIVLLMVSAITFLPEFNKGNNNSSNYQLSDTEYYDINMDDLYYAYNDDKQIVSSNTEVDNETVDYLTEEMDLDEIIVLSEK